MPQADNMTPVPQYRRQTIEQIEEAVAHCDEATNENERVVDCIKELLSAGDSGRLDRRNAPAR